MGFFEGSEVPVDDKRRARTDTLGTLRDGALDHVGGSMSTLFHRLLSTRLAWVGALFMAPIVSSLAEGSSGAEQTLRPRITLSADAPGGMCELGETVVFTAEVRNSSKDKLNGELRWELETVAFDAKELKPTKLQLKGKETKTFQYELEMKVSGFVKVSCTVAERGEREVTRSKRVGCDPTGVLSELTREEDFDEFWAQSIKELAEVEPEYELIEVTQEEGADGELYELIMRSHGDVRVRGWLQVPKTEGPHSALLRVPGYTQNMRPVGDTGGAVILSFNIRGHGNSTDDVPGHPRDFWVRGLDDKETYYYRGAYLDCVRAVDYLSSRDDVDQDRIAVWGGSQGGGLSFATAALDQRIDLCVADIPWLCDWENYLTLAGKTDDEEIQAWLDAKKSRTPESTLKILSYFDTMNMADRIQCPTLMGVGLQDSVCPPSTSFATFNRITAERDFRIYEESGHGLGAAHYQWVLGEMAKHLGR